MILLSNVFPVYLRKELPRMRQVNYFWKLTIDSLRFYAACRSISFFPSIFTVRCIHDRYECLDADLADLSSPRLLFSCPAEAGLNLFPHGFTLASVGNFVLAMAPGRHVLKFSLISRQWVTVSKTMPSWCELRANTVGSQVIVIGCDDRQEDIGDMVTFCEVYDHNKDSWMSTEGLPEDFICNLCLTCNGSAFARGFLTSGCDGSAFARGFLMSGGYSVYALDLANRRWEENEDMLVKLQHLTHESKVVAVPRGFLAASHIGYNLLVQHQGPVHDRWISVMREYS